MNPFARTFFIATFVVSIVVADTCYGQLSAPRIRRRNNFGTSVQSHIQNRPTVSPYLNLLNNSSREGIPSYFTQVRPQLQARAAAQRAEQSIEDAVVQFGSGGQADGVELLTTSHVSIIYTTNEDVGTHNSIR